MKSKSSNRYVIIMAGGKGERFWPVSRLKTPKQLIRLLGDKSFLQEAVKRVEKLIPHKNILIITNKDQAKQVQKQLPKIPKANIIAEPIGRDTCAAVTLGAAIVGQRSPDAVMAVLPADHVIPDEKAFQQVLSDCFDVAVTQQVIVTIGIKPTEPATGYGYMRSGLRLSLAYKTAFFKAEKFVEKPNYDKAVEYLSSGNYRWNAGMFIWSYATVSQGLKQHEPEMAEACQRWLQAAQKGKLDKVLAKEYPVIKKISIDYALLEKAGNVIVADGAFAWDDLGAWPALGRHITPDALGNSAVADFIQVDSQNNIVFDARTKNRTPVAMVGVQDSILVLTDDATMVAHKAKAQKIKDLVAQLASSKKFRKLV